MVNPNLLVFLVCTLRLCGGPENPSAVLDHGRSWLCTINSVQPVFPDVPMEVECAAGLSPRLRLGGSRVQGCVASAYLLSSALPSPSQTVPPHRQPVSPNLFRSDRDPFGNMAPDTFGRATSLVYPGASEGSHCIWARTLGDWHGYSLSFEKMATVSQCSHSRSEFDRGQYRTPSSNCCA